MLFYFYAVGIPLSFVQPIPNRLRDRTLELLNNVLPLIKKHFEKRYADQRWIIYDSQRKGALSSFLFFGVSWISPEESWPV